MTLVQQQLSTAYQITSDSVFQLIYVEGLEPVPGLFSDVNENITKEE